jgi:Spy/CpxP family protein refolding chaperone
MKLTTITMALAFIAGTAGLGSIASAQDRGPPPVEQGMRHDGPMNPGQMHNDQMRRDTVRRDVHVRRDVRHVERQDRRNWGHKRHCRTVWRHHRRIKQCW